MSYARQIPLGAFVTLLWLFWFALCYSEARTVDLNGSASVCLLRIMINAEVSLCSAKQRYKLTKLFKIAYNMNQNHITVQKDSKSRNYQIIMSDNLD